MVLIFKKMFIVMALYMNVAVVYPQTFATGIVQYGNNIDYERLELLEDRLAIRSVVEKIQSYERAYCIINGVYTVHNSGSEYQATLGILLQEWGGSPSPHDVQFFVNNEHVNHYVKRNFGSVSFGDEIKDTPQSSTCWILIDVRLPANSTVVVDVRYKTDFANNFFSYNDTFLNHFPRMLYWKGNAKLSIEIINDSLIKNNVESLWITNMEFRSLTNDRDNDINSAEYLQTMLDMKTSFMDIQRKNGNAFIIKFKEEFYQNYHRSFSINGSYWGGELGAYLYINLGVDWEIIKGIRLNPLDLDGRRSILNIDNANISRRMIGPYELIFLTDNQLQIMRNAFYAQYGYIFDSKDLQNMFEDVSIYTPNPDFHEDMLTEIDRANIETIRRLEELSQLFLSVDQHSASEEAISSLRTEEAEQSLNATGIIVSTVTQGKKTLPLWLWFAIGGAVAVGGAVFVIKRKK